MKTHKTRKYGDEIVIDVPLGIEEGKEYVVMKGRDGAFTYIPREESIFKKAERERKTIEMEKE